MVKHVHAAELRILVAAVLAVAADAVLVAQRLLNLCANLVTATSRLRVRNLTRRSSLEAESKWEKKGGEERRNARNSVWQFGTGNRKCRWREFFEIAIPGPWRSFSVALYNELMLKKTRS